MIIRHLATAESSERRVIDPQGNWESTRLLLRDDGMGFSFHITTIYAGKRFRMHYKHHLESVYCLSGRGSIRCLADNSTHAITPGTLYALNEHDEHILSADTDCQFACVFNPPVTGQEVHNAEGAYDLPETTSGETC